MTIALTIKVNDGLVLAADSASSLMIASAPGAPANQVLNVYNNANKIFNLVKGLPIGALVWGSGAIGTQSIETLMKDLREEFTKGGRGFDPKKYSVKFVADAVREFLWVERYEKFPIRAEIGIIVAGYPRGEASQLSEEYRIVMTATGCDPPTLLRAPEASGMSWNGMMEPISRLVWGVGTDLGRVLKERLGVPENQVPMAVQVLQQSLAAQLIFPPMPIQDVIDLAEYLVNMTIGYYRFFPGAPCVGGPVEIAAITKHEGFRWVQRKHYFAAELNPPFSKENEEQGRR